jgi:hypothetical protein
MVDIDHQRMGAIIKNSTRPMSRIDGSKRSELTPSDEDRLGWVENEGLSLLTVPKDTLR